jgi:hypothetical protein
MLMVRRGDAGRRHWYRMSTEVGGSFWLMPHVGCEWRGEFAMGMPEAAC